MQPHPIRPVDAAYLSLDTANTTGNVALLLPLDRVITLTELREQVSGRLPLEPILRMRVHEVAFGLDRPWWVDDTEFDIDRHVREHEVPEPGGPVALGALVASLAMAPLPRAHPLWAMHLLHDPTTGQCAVLSIVHHAIADGSRNRDLLVSLFGPSPGRLPTDGWRPVRPAGDLELIWRGALENAGWWMRNTASTLTKLTLSSARLMIPSGQSDPPVTGHLTSAPSTPFNKTVSARRGWAFASLPLDRLAPARRALGVTVNDVLHAMTASALRDWLQRQHALPHTPLVVLVPISVRTDDDDPLAGNRISMGVSTLPTDVDTLPGRLRAAHQAMAAAKANPMFGDHLMDLVARLSGGSTSAATRAAADLSLAWRVMDYAPSAGTNLVISNVNMGSDRYQVGDAVVTHIYPMPPISNGQGLNITAQGYQGQLDIGVSACAELVADVESIVASMVAAYEQVCALDGQSGR